MATLTLPLAQSEIVRAKNVRAPCPVTVAGPVGPGIYVTDAPAIQVGRLTDGTYAVLVDTFEGWQWYRYKDIRATMPVWTRLDSVAAELTRTARPVMPCYCDTAYHPAGH